MGAGEALRCILTVIPTHSRYKGARGRSTVGMEEPAMANLYGGEVILRVRAELVAPAAS